MRKPFLLAIGMILFFSLPTWALDRDEADETLARAMVNFRKAVETDQRPEQKKYLTRAVDNFRKVFCRPNLDRYTQEVVPRLAEELPNPYVRSLYFYTLFVSFVGCERLPQAKFCLERALEMCPNPPPEWRKDMERLLEAIRRKESHSR